MAWAFASAAKRSAAQQRQHDAARATRAPPSLILFQFFQRGAAAIDLALRPGWNGDSDLNLCRHGQRSILSGLLPERVAGLDTLAVQHSTVNDERDPCRSYLSTFAGTYDWLAVSARLADRATTSPS
ncbi:MAG: hypothetical protein MZV65_02115 [Chromatiales bacterium]|nr:hypothetical protein [Chromatiales bacterium]